MSKSIQDRIADAIYRTLSGKYGDFGYPSDAAAEVMKELDLSEELQTHKSAVPQPRLLEKWNWVPKKYVLQPQGRMVEAIRSNWWIVDDAGNVCLYRDRKNAPLSPQCNPDKRIAEKVFNSKSAPPEAAGIEQIPLAFVTMRPGDY